MANEIISVKFLLHLVEERPAVWDKTSEDYKDLHLKKISWREICALVNENYYSLSDSERDVFTKKIMKKWGHIRDAWLKSMKHGYDEVTKLPSKPYLYHNELKFIQKLLKCKPHRFDLSQCQPSNAYFEEFFRGANETQNSQGTLENVEYDYKINEQKHPDIALKQEELSINNSQAKLSEAAETDEFQSQEAEAVSGVEEEKDEKTECIKPKRTSIFVTSRDNKCNHMEKKVSPTFLSNTMPTYSKVEISSSNQQKTDHNLIEQRHWSFLKGIFPSIISLDEDHTLQFQLGVLSLLQNLRESKRQKEKQKSNRLSSHSLAKGRGRKRKATMDDDDWATTSNYIRRKSNRQNVDPIGSENEGSGTNCSSND